NPTTLGSTTAIDDATIGDIDPDFPHSWWTIRPATPLPRITKPVTINGYSQTGSQPNSNLLRDGDNAILRIELDGSLSGNRTDIPLNTQFGLNITAGQSTVKGLVINRFTYGGIIAEGNGHNTIQGNFIGTDPAGRTSLVDNVTLTSDSNLVGTNGDGIG